MPQMPNCVNEYYFVHVLDYQVCRSSKLLKIGQYLVILKNEDFLSYNSYM